MIARSTTEYFNILDDREAEYKRKRRLSLGALILSGLCLIAAAVLWGIYIDRNIVIPFRKMEKFAGEVAAGNLDAPMEMDRNNLFGIFTESFDIMREELAKAREAEIRLKQQEKEKLGNIYKKAEQNRCMAELIKTTVRDDGFEGILYPGDHSKDKTT